jgi:aspartate aminotransferase-like enzyme
MRADVLGLGASQPQYFRTEHFSDWMLGLAAKFRQGLGLPASSEIIFLTGSGTAGMEAAAANFLPTPNFLAISSGQFGERMCEIVERRRFDFDRWSLDSTLSPAENLRGRELGRYRCCFSTIAETSNGYFLDPRLIRAAGLPDDSLLICDGITAAFVDDFDIGAVDILIVGSQKGLGLAPGMCFIVLSEKAVKSIVGKTCDSLYFDFNLYINNMKRGQTPFTPGLSVLYQLDRALDHISAEGGLSALTARRKALATAFREELDRGGVAYSRKYVSNCVTVIQTGTVDAECVVRGLKDRFDITVATNSPPYKKSHFRVSHMGHNTIGDMELAARAISSVLGGKT